MSIAIFNLKFVLITFSFHSVHLVNDERSDWELVQTLQPEQGY